ncbi:MAG: ABC transporter permease [Bacteroidales bacterium]|nr:ABC transporter permease [Bacteroidales bacterium]
MNLKKINVVIGREYSTRVRKKSFLITTFVVPILFAAICILPSVLMMNVKEKSQKVSVVDNSGIVMPYLESNEAAVFTDCTSQDIETLKATVGGDDCDVLLVVSPLDSAKSVSIQVYSRKPAGVEFYSGIADRANRAVEAYRISSYDIEGLETIMKDVKADVKVSEFTIDASGKATVSESGIYMIVSMILGMMIYMFIAMFGGSVMSSVIEEKSSRVVEVLVSSVKATELMFGKIIGIALVALTQFFLWIILTVILVVAAGAIFGFSDMASSAQMAGMAQAGMGGVDVAQAAQGGEFGVILTTLANLPWMRLIICFIIYFILGYLLYASMYSAIGSAVENEADTQQLQLPVTIPLMIAFFIVFFAFKNPDSPVVWWGSMIPFTSPIVMIARIPYGVPVWELVVSIVVLLLTFFVLAWCSAKIYKAGILMFGKKSSWADLFKWLKQK